MERVNPVAVVLLALFAQMERTYTVSAAARPVRVDGFASRRSQGAPKKSLAMAAPMEAIPSASTHTTR